MARPSESILGRMRWPLAFIALTSGVGIAGYLVSGDGIVDAVTKTVLVLTTLGFSTAGTSDAHKLFTDVLALLGVSAYLGILAALAGALADGQFGAMSRQRRLRRRIARMRDHVVVCAYGRVGRAAARALREEGVPFVVIERREDLEPAMRESGVLYLLGDPVDEDLLVSAGIRRARALVSAVDSDADSVYITLTARSLNDHLFIVARAGEEPTPKRLYRAGADRVVSPYVASGSHMATIAVRPRLVDYLEIAAPDGRKLRLDELLVEDRSPLVGASVGEVAGRSRPLLLRRGDGTWSAGPPGSDVLQAGDLLVLLADSAGSTARQQSAPARAPAEMENHFILCAYGRAGRSVARSLEAEGVPFVVVEQLKEVEDQLRMDGVTYIIGDPTRERVLREAGIERARGLICAVDSDAANVYIVLGGRSINPDVFIVARASDPQSSSRLARAGADRVVSPYVTSGRHMALLALRPRVVDYLEVAGRDDRSLRLDELIAVPGSPLVGRTIGEVANGSMPLLLQRAAGETVPNPGAAERLEPDDLIVLLDHPGASPGAGKR